MLVSGIFGLFLVFLFSLVKGVFSLPFPVILESH